MPVHWKQQLAEQQEGRRASRSKLLLGLAGVCVVAVLMFTVNSLQSRQEPSSANSKVVALRARAHEVSVSDVKPTGPHGNRGSDTVVARHHKDMGDHDSSDTPAPTAVQSHKADETKKQGEEEQQQQQQKASDQQQGQEQGQANGFPQQEHFYKPSEFKFAPDENELVIKTLYKEVKSVFVATVEPAGRAPPKGDVVLLHGAAFSAATWDKIELPQHLAQQGYRVFAMDLPGYGRSQGRVPTALRAKFLQIMLATMGANKPVLVSPSMSGSFSIPLVMSPSVRVLSGFVPVAPVAVDKFEPKQFARVDLPTLIVYGQKDKGGSGRSRTLANIPNSTTFMIPNGSHPCYLDDPGRFERVLFNFLLQVFTDSSSSSR